MIGLIAALAYALTAFAALLVAAILSGNAAAAVCVGLSAGAAYAFQVVEDGRTTPGMAPAQVALWAFSLLFYGAGVAIILFR